MNSTALTTMGPETLAGLMERVTDVARNDDGTLAHIEITEMADGSRRTVAVATMVSAEHEQTYRVASPAPWNAPAWAPRAWTIDVRMGDEWLALDEEAVA